MNIDTDTTVFPTRVGVNRRSERRGRGCLCFPHTRGGEPCPPYRSTSRIGVFPTRVGVNRCLKASTLPLIAVFPTRVGVNR